MIEDTAAKQVVEEARGLLLGPVYLVHEIIAVLLPGLLFCVLLLAKHNSIVISALQTTLVGYRTKLFLGLFISYVIGKAFTLPLAAVEGSLLRAPQLTGADASEAPEPRKEAAHAVARETRLSRLIGKSSPIDILMMIYMDVAFYFTTGIVLVLSSLIPGDGYLRVIEFVTGIFMLWVSCFPKARKLHIAQAGIRGTSKAQAHSPPEAN